MEPVEPLSNRISARGGNNGAERIPSEEVSGARSRRKRRRRRRRRRRKGHSLLRGSGRQDRRT